MRTLRYSINFTLDRVETNRIGAREPAGTRFGGHSHAVGAENLMRECRKRNIIGEAPFLNIELTRVTFCFAGAYKIKRKERGAARFP